MMRFLIALCVTISFFSSIYNALAANDLAGGSRGTPVPQSETTGDVRPQPVPEFACLPITYGTEASAAGSDDTHLADGMVRVESAPSYIHQPEGQSGYACYEFTVTGGPKTTVVDFMLSSNGSADLNSFTWSIDENPPNPDFPAMRHHDEATTSSFTSNTGEWIGNGSSSSPEFAPKTFNLSDGTHTLYIRSNPDDLGIRISAVKVYEQTSPPGTLIAAACNGSTDDTSTINAAIAAAASGTRLVLPNGTCKVTGEVVFNGPDNLTLVGSGSSVLSWSGSKSTTISVIDIRSTSTGTTIGSGLTVDGNLKACTGIRVEGNNTTVDGTVIKELESTADLTCSGAYGIDVYKADNFKLDNVTVSDVRSFLTTVEGDENAAIGVFVRGASGDYPLNTILEDSEIRYVVGRYDGDCVQLAPGINVATNWGPSTNAKVRRMTFTDCSERAMKISQSGVLVEDVTVNFTDLGDKYLDNNAMPMIRRGIAIMFRAANGGTVRNSTLTLSGKHDGIGLEYFTGGLTIENVDVIPTVTPDCPSIGSCGYGQNGVSGFITYLNRSLPSGSPGTISLNDLRVCGSTAVTKSGNSIRLYGDSSYPNYAYKFNFTDVHTNRGANNEGPSNYDGAITSSKAASGASSFGAWSGSFGTSGACP